MHVKEENIYYEIDFSLSHNMTPKLMTNCFNIISMKLKIIYQSHTEAHFWWMFN